jgi:hypothetical protein
LRIVDECVEVCPSFFSNGIALGSLANLTVGIKLGTMEVVYNQIRDLAVV